MLLLIFINFTYIYHKLQKDIILNDNNWIIYTYYDYKNKLSNYIILLHMKKFDNNFLLTLNLIITNYKKNLIFNDKSSIIYSY